MDSSWFFSGWDAVARVAVCAPVVYALVIAAVRVSGKRATSQMNNFDWIVTVAIGSIVGSAVVLESVPLASALVAIGMLLGLQFAVTASSARWAGVRRAVQAAPTVLLYRGAFQDAALRTERVTRQEVMAAIREAGLPGPDAVHAVVLETDASMSVLPASEDGADFACLEGLGPAIRS
ncbi:DUF421 domain-containing protein [Rubrivirga marina]|uniref:DUF421 domain-containing protein n=1 Tax=Rubrivirga marina TaxID=1196024 RepID=A0A271IZ51_9BACT|nr:YetF domain-containing protein [Rubrivirga marina]PAP76357.1 hypothetical protein BSZ37_07820 [Rubrivirga marina]